MKIEHLAIWAIDLEQLKWFYQKYFGLTSNKKYHNPAKNFSSYFLSFSCGVRLELMHKPEVSAALGQGRIRPGLAHIAISLGSRDQVDQLTEQMRADGVKIVGEPRTTGDGYYESVVEDPEGNLIELTI